VPSREAGVAIDVIGAASGVLIIVGLVLALAAPILLAIVLFRLGTRRFSGRRGRHDALFDAMGKASAMNSHLQAGTPDPEDLAVPSPVVGPPGGLRRRRRGRRL
jgi:hypothetical protein